MGNGKEREVDEQARRRLLGNLIALTMVAEHLNLEFCRTAAILTRSRARDGLPRASSIEWISAHCQLTKADTADRVAIGEAMLKRFMRSQLSEA